MEPLPTLERRHAHRLVEEFEGSYEMNAKNISLTLAALAALSTTAAFADEVVVNPVGAAVNTTAGVVNTAVTAPIKVTNNLVHSIFHPMGPWFDLSVMGVGVSLGGEKTIVTPAVSSNGLQVLTNAAVIPGRVALATPVSENIEAPGHVFDLGLFGFGIHAGRVPKALDMR
jgi:hypothetical protein